VPVRRFLAKRAKTERDAGDPVTGPAVLHRLASRARVMAWRTSLTQTGPDSNYMRVFA
jgi:hypothetical protein